jgi:CO/xanthine dehydrogenase Mo-binding subunit
MDIELETGVTRDGRIVARRGRMVLDKGAYTGEGGFFAQMAAMHACGPYKLDTVRVEAFLNYSTNQPAASIRAPTAPQACWALEQHMDEVAAGNRPRPVEAPAPTLIDGRQPDRPGLTTDRHETDPRGRARDDRLRPVLRGELRTRPSARCGWWPSMASPSGAYVKAQR